MAIVTTTIPCKAGAWTALTAGDASLSFRIKKMLNTTVVRLAAAASTPALTTTDYIAISDHKWKEFGLLTGNIYVMPMTSDADVEVIKG